MEKSKEKRKIVLPLPGAPPAPPASWCPPSPPASWCPPSPPTPHLPISASPRHRVTASLDNDTFTLTCHQ
ncbi:MAG: hypothetical protein F6K31_09400 [Symploca sp. SIO2G7]|nr:hypothetical protein [Symploca sp. SIO2G7]